MYCRVLVSSVLYVPHSLMSRLLHANPTVTHALAATPALICLSFKSSKKSLSKSNTLEWGSLVKSVLTMPTASFLEIFFVAQCSLAACCHFVDR
jgi:hypothetical protein